MPAKESTKKARGSTSASSSRAPSGSSEALPESVAEWGREVWLAGLGALATVEKEGSRLFSTLVERGQTMETEGKNRIGSAKDDLSTRQKETAGKLEETVYTSARNTMERLGVPTRTEMDTLSKQVEALSRKLDTLTAMLEARTSDPKAD